MTKQTITFGAGALALVLLGLGALYLIRSYIPEYQARKAYEQLLEEYKNDPYGGDTPEETLQLFIDALKKGDVELAAKYFEWAYKDKLFDQLKKFANEKIINDVIADLEKLKLGKQDNEQAFFEYFIEGVGTVDVVMHKNSTNGKWKIIEL